MALTINLNAQDVITKRNGDDIDAKVLEILDSEHLFSVFSKIMTNTALPCNARPFH